MESSPKRCRLRSGLIPAGVALVLSLPAPATEPTPSGFTPSVRAFVVRRARTLMPASLRRQLERHEPSLLAGALEPLIRGRAEPADRCPLAAAVERAIAALDGQRPMAEVAARFGAIAFEAAELAFPFPAGEATPLARDVAPAHARYIESKLDRIAVTFPGYADPALAAGDLDAFCRWVRRRAARDRDGILRAYRPEGRASRPEDFDDRSIPFAAASLEVSLAVTATARAWLFAWQRAHGDLGATPTLGPSSLGAPFGRPAASDIAPPSAQERRE